MPNCHNLFGEYEDRYDDYSDSFDDQEAAKERALLSFSTKQFACGAGTVKLVTAVIVAGPLAIVGTAALSVGQCVIANWNWELDEEESARLQLRTQRDKKKKDDAYQEYLDCINDHKNDGIS